MARSVKEVLEERRASPERVPARSGGASRTSLTDRETGGLSVKARGILPDRIRLTARRTGKMVAYRYVEEFADTPENRAAQRTTETMLRALYAGRHVSRKFRFRFRFGRRGRTLNATIDCVSSVEVFVRCFVSELLAWGSPEMRDRIVEVLAKATGMDVSGMIGTATNGTGTVKSRGRIVKRKIERWESK